LARNSIQDDGTEYIALALRNNTAVTMLNLDENQIDTRGANCLLKELQQNTVAITIQNQRVFSFIYRLF